MQSIDVYVALCTIKAFLKRFLMQTKINLIKRRINQELVSAGELNPFQKILDFINGLSGWLLFFYLVFYFIAGFVIAKKIPFIKDVPTVFYIFQTGNIKYLLPIIFLLHISTSLKLNIFKKNILSDFLISPLFIIFSLLIVFNF